MSKEKKHNITYAEPSNYFPKHIRDEVEREEAERKAAERISTHRVKLVNYCMSKTYLENILEPIAETMRGMTEPQKEDQAQKILALIKPCQSEEEAYSVLENAGIFTSPRK